MSAKGCDCFHENLWREQFHHSPFWSVDEDCSKPAGETYSGSCLYLASFYMNDLALHNTNQNALYLNSPGFGLDFL